MRSERSRQTAVCLHTNTTALRLLGHLIVVKVKVVFVVCGIGGRTSSEPFAALKVGTSHCYVAVSQTGPSRSTYQPVGREFN